MCSAMKTDPAAMPPKKPYRSLMASLTMKQRSRFAKETDRAQTRHEIRQSYRDKYREKQARKRKQGQVGVVSWLIRSLKKFMAG
jgi:hypothetical protein